MLTPLQHVIAHVRAQGRPNSHGAILLAEIERLRTEVERLRAEVEKPPMPDPSPADLRTFSAALAEISRLRWHIHSFSLAFPEMAHEALTSDLGPPPAIAAELDRLRAAIQAHHDVKHGSVHPAAVLAPPDQALYAAGGVEFRALGASEGGRTPPAPTGESE